MDVSLTSDLAAFGPSADNAKAVISALAKYLNRAIASMPISSSVTVQRASTGRGRSVIYTEKDFSRFRLAFSMRHVSGNPDHQACVLDALGGIQFQVPNGGHWDYRVGRNDNGGNEFTQIVKGQFNVHEPLR